MNKKLITAKILSDPKFLNIYQELLKKDKSKINRFKYNISEDIEEGKINPNEQTTNFLDKILGIYNGEDTANAIFNAAYMVGKSNILPKKLDKILDWIGKKRFKE